ncbi:unnamed protein product, partial [marine sediment metagenome]
MEIESPINNTRGKPGTSSICTKVGWFFRGLGSAAFVVAPNQKSNN